jgi:hypothetical protein
LSCTQWKGSSFSNIFIKFHSNVLTGCISLWSTDRLWETDMVFCCLFKNVLKAVHHHLSVLLLLFMIALWPYNYCVLQSSQPACLHVHRFSIFAAGYSKSLLHTIPLNVFPFFFLLSFSAKCLTGDIPDIAWRSQYKRGAQ